MGKYEFAIIAMGCPRGAEIGYFSDADVMFALPSEKNLDADARSTLSSHVRRVALEVTNQLGSGRALPDRLIDSTFVRRARRGCSCAL